MMVTVLMMTMGVILALVPSGYVLAMAVGLVGAWGMGLHMAWLAATVDLDDPQSCLSSFRALTQTGMILVVGLVLALLVI